MPRRGEACLYNKTEAEVLIAGVPVPGLIAVTIDSVGHFSADRFRLAFTTALVPGFDISYFAGLGGQQISIAVSQGGDGYVPLFTGLIDNIRIDFRTNTAVLSGRDLSALMIDTDVAESFLNQTASQIATTIAARHGLNAQVTATKDLIGQYYDLDHARTILSLSSKITNEWGLLCQLAQIEGYYLGVTGSTLIFQPETETVVATLPKTAFSQLGVDIVAVIPQVRHIKSWNCRQKTAVDVSSGAGGRVATGIRPNLNSATAQSIAETEVGLLVRQGALLTGTMPGELTIQPGVRVGLYGTSSSFDATYAVESVRRQVDQRSGFQQIIRAFLLTT